MSTVEVRASEQQASEGRETSIQTTCCIVGGGPAGVLLSLLLARRGVSVTLLEAHLDFDREFRGDTLHPSVLEILDEIGLTEPLHRLRHAKIDAPRLRTASGPFTPIDLRRLKTRFPYIMLIPQAVFLRFVIEEAQRHSQFRLVMGANVQELIKEHGVVQGVRYGGPDVWKEVRALLTIGADGRFSRVRHLAGFELIKTSPPMDVLWFRLPHLPGDPELFGLARTQDAAGVFEVRRPDSAEEFGGGFGRIGGGAISGIFDRGDHWQGAYVFAKGRYQELRAAGLEAMRRRIVALEPRLAEHVGHLKDWRQLSLLSVESGRCACWYKPGLLLIGDAAHVMSPVGGVGINYAIQDAVVAANVLLGPLRAGRVSESHLAEVQSQREWPTRFIQFAQSLVQKRIISQALQSQGDAKVPHWIRLLFRIPMLRDLPARIVAFGLRRVHVLNNVR